MYKQMNCPQSLLILPFTRKEILKNVLLTVPAPSELVSARQFLLLRKVSVKLCVKVLKVHLNSDHLPKCPLEQRVALWCWLDSRQPPGQGTASPQREKGGVGAFSSVDLEKPPPLSGTANLLPFPFFLKPKVPGGGCISVRRECFRSPPVLMVEADCRVSPNSSLERKQSLTQKPPRFHHGHTGRHCKIQRA